MGLELIQGPPNSGRAGAVLDRFRASLDAGPLLVVPTSDDVSTFERSLCADLGAARGGSVSTFAGLAREVARTLATELGPPLSEIQRQALVRAAIRASSPRLLRRSAARPGFTPAVERLIAELQAALIGPERFARDVDELGEAGFERELATIYAAYVELRDAGGRSDAGQVSAAVLAAFASGAEWGERPLFVYGFDDLARDQTELLRGIARTAPVTVALTYADSRALAPRAGLLARLVDELGAEPPEPLPFDPDYTASATLRHLDRNLFEPGATPIDADDGIALLDSAGPRGEAEAIGIEIARLLADGHEPDEIAIVVRHPDSSGPVLAAVLATLGIPVALEASIALSATCVGTSLIALCRAAIDDRDVGALLTHLRTDPSLDPGVVDWVERRIRRGKAPTVAEATGWERPPRHLARLLATADRRERLRALARSARELSEGAHREDAPLAAGSASHNGERPFSALELRAGFAAAELLTELADLAELEGAEPPDLAEAIEAIEGAAVPRWRGPASGRVRIMSPYRARAARARALFCAGLQEGVFPSAAPPDPLLSQERRAELGNPDLRRADQADEERYLFHACVSRPTERLYLSWQSCDEDGAALARSPFVDEVLDLVAADAESAERLIRARGPERAVIDAGEATTPRLLARALARDARPGQRPETIARLGVDPADATRTLELFAGLPDPEAKPGPLRSPHVVEPLGERRTFSANSLEGWVQCSYKWFVDHELSPQVLDPAADPLWLGGVVHAALERLYADPPGDDSIPRPADLARWQRRFGELLDEGVGDLAALTRARRALVERARAQVEAFLADESAIETEFRPARELLELGFGELDHEPEDAPPSRPSLELGEIELRGRIDRIDLAPDGRSAIVRDYKTGKAVASADKFSDLGTLQIQLYMLVARRVLGLEPVAGLYQPLGAPAPKDRRARGVADRDDERLAGLGLVGTDRKPPEELEALLASAEESALGAATRMRAGDIDRDPLNGECPSYCTYQPICRLERALGEVGEERQSGDES